ncbi:MAG: carboxypeptidase-like regulatory domain-containing protein [Burkholderiales bacterium]|nr:carboxypeptidase-like regulatory domain-containing protein [Bacteroidia bacterium]
MKNLTLAVILCFVSSLAISQTFSVSGKITDDKSQALSFSSVLVKGTTQGTNANADGFYFLRLQPGTYELIFQYVGYKKKVEKVTVEENATKNVSLIPESYELKEVVISDGEDPAYAVIRQAIKKRKYYLNEVNAFTCKAYIKGLQRLKDFPKKMAKLINAMNTSGGDKIDSTLLGVVYLSESETKYHFRKPNDEKEIMYSSKVSGDNKAFSFNQVSDMKFSVYENLISLDGLSDRPFISPINENALLSYRYKLLGTTFEDGKLLNKIEITPKRKTDPCFRGIIYIQENTWRVHSADVYLTKDAKIDFVDTLYIKQLNAPVNDTTWMPMSLNMTFNFKVFGFKGDGYFNAVFSDYDMHPVFPKKFFKNEVLKVEDGANKKDTLYWGDSRPVPLTAEEKTDYRKKDSIGLIKNSDRYKDSVDRDGNKLTFSDLIMGYSYNKSAKKFSLNTSGLLTSGVQYNTVEGVNASLKVDMNKRYENNRYHDISATARYGFSNYLWGGTINWKYLHKPEKFESFNIKLGTSALQFNGNDPINPTINTSYTLLNNDNFMKLYKKTYAAFNFKRELINGLITTFHTEYAERSALRNTTTDLWVDDKNKLFTSNDPMHPTSDDSSFTVNNSFVVEIGVSIRFKQKYYTRPHEKIIVGSKYPILNLYYTKAIPGLNTKADYDLAKISIDDNFKLGLVGTFAYRLKGGYFLSNRYVEFMDYKHFDGNQTLLANNDYLNSFKLLPYYTYSTKNWYAEGHAEHHFNGFIFNKIPLLKKTRIQEVVGGHILFNDKLDQYYEINFGIEHIFQIVRIDYILGYGPSGRFNQGFVIGLGLEF